MLITKYVKLKINSKTISHYIEKGYDVNVNKEYKLKIEDVTKGSKILVTAKCDICGKEKEITYKEYNRNIKKYNIFSCSNKCATIKNKKTNLKKYGVEHFSKTDKFLEKYKKTNLKKYGNEYFTKTNKYKELIKNKNIDYSIRNEKKKKTFLKKYGVDDYHKSKKYLKNKNKILEKYKKTVTNKLLNKYDNLISTDNSNYKFLCTKGHTFNITRELLKNRKKINTQICTICNPINSAISGLENQLQKFIKDNYNSEIQINKRKIIPPYELDIYLPNLNIAFEFNGLYWHNEENKSNNYHLEKTELCEKNNIHLTHIYEDDWIYKQNIVKSMILNKLNLTPNKIYARKTEVKEINDNKLVREFLDNNHIQGFIGSKIKLGLFYENELISLMTFGKRRVAMGKKKTNKDEYELLRFCNKLNTNILGGASKLFKYFINNYNPKDITTYADRSYSQGKMYEKLGFKYQGKTQPNYYYIIDGIKQHRFNYRKDKLIKEGFDSNKTEHEIMLDRNIYRIYDSGNLKFEINF